MDLKKILIILGAGILALVVLYGLILVATSVFFTHQSDMIEPDNEELIESIHEAPNIEVVQAEENYVLRLRNSNDEEISLESLEFSANGETITDQVSYEKDSIPAQETTEVNTGIETGETVSFEVSAGDTASHYECDYTPGAATC